MKTPHGGRKPALFLYLCVCNACKRVYAYKASDGSGFGGMQFATDYNNGITYVMNALSMRVGSGPEKSD